VRSDQLNRIDAALKRGFDFLAGDPITLVSPQNVEYDLVCIMYDTKLEGVEVESFGMVEDGLREVLFLKEYLTDESIDLDSTWYFLIDGERWDFAPKSPIMEKVVPLYGLQNMIVCYLTKAAEVEATEQTATWGWNTSV
jgi:hypothetical protein